MTRARPFAFPAVALMLIVTTIWLYLDGAARRDAERAGADAVAAARESIVAMGSYRPETAEQSLTAARDRLTGVFLDTYNQAITTVVIPSARQQRIASEVSVPAAGAVSASRDRAVVLAYVDRSISVGTQPPSAEAARYRVGMQKVDGRWLIAAFDQI